MPAMHSLLIYALKDGAPVSIMDVESGLKCGCVCPVCNAPLVAKHPNPSAKRPMKDHFAHRQKDSCAYGYQTSLHLAAKDILSKATTMVIPAVETKTLEGFRNRFLIEKKTITIDKVELEKQIDNIIPDVVVHTGDKRLLVEIYVTHCIDDAKLEKIKESGLSTIEIDLHEKRDIITREELREHLLHSSEAKKWMYNAEELNILREIHEVADKRSAKFDRSKHMIVCRSCPTSKVNELIRTAFGERFVRGCESCNYFWGLDGNPYDFWSCFDVPVLCTQRLGIANIDDLRRLQKENAQKG